MMATITAFSSKREGQAAWSTQPHHAVRQHMGAAQRHTPKCSNRAYNLLQGPISGVRKISNTYLVEMKTLQ